MDTTTLLIIVLVIIVLAVAFTVGLVLAPVFRLKPLAAELVAKHFRMFLRREEKTLYPKSSRRK